VASVREMPSTAEMSFFMSLSGFSFSSRPFLSASVLIDESHH
jgi:hypothetical protein